MDIWIYGLYGLCKVEIFYVKKRHISLLKRREILVLFRNSLFFFIHVYLKAHI